LQALGLPQRSTEEVRGYVGKGITRLVERCLTGDPDRSAEPAQLERAVALFSAAYEEESGRHCAVFAGVAEGLEALAAHGLRLACVTNKPERFTVPLLERMRLARRFDAIVCADKVGRAK